MSDYMKTVVKLNWKQCEVIARYYEFPTVVFLLNQKDMLRKLQGTRKESIKDSLKELRAMMNELIDRAHEVL